MKKPEFPIRVRRWMRRTRRFALYGALSLILGLSGCASVPSAAEPCVALQVESVKTEALDQYRILFTLSLRLVNEGQRTLESVSVSFSLALNGTPASAETLGEPLELSPGQAQSIQQECTIDLRDLSSQSSCLAEFEEIPWTLTVEARGSEAGGGEPLGTAEAEGVCPLVREPALTIKSIVLVKYELVNVLLELILDVRNPNAFPVEFSSAVYQFYGEGRKWANGRVEKSVTIPPRGTSEVRLPIELNFTDTGRSLFDLVAKLKVVRYRLAGQARISTPLAFLPEFQMKFDESGATKVERSLSPGP